MGVLPPLSYSLVSPVFADLMVNPVSLTGNNIICNSWSGVDSSVLATIQFTNLGGYRRITSGSLQNYAGYRNHMSFY